ncbi:MAG: class I SAM-dependent methyltransferase [Anaerolineales bacterium]
MTLQKDPEGFERKILHKYAAFTNKRLLEVGCGEGRLTWQYAKAMGSTIGIDLDVDALRVASIDRPYDLAGKVHFSCAESEHLPFSKETFDMAILAWSL